MSKDTGARANVRVVGSFPSSARAVRSSRSFGLIRGESLEVPGGGTHKIRGGTGGIWDC